MMQKAAKDVHNEFTNRAGALMMPLNPPRAAPEMALERVGAR
jgi:hypothetical protein